jgi:hypothetical protein
MTSCQIVGITFILFKYYSFTKIIFCVYNDIKGKVKEFIFCNGIIGSVYN